MSEMIYGRLAERVGVVVPRDYFEYASHIGYDGIREYTDHVINSFLPWYDEEQYRYFHWFDFVDMLDIETRYIIDLGDEDTPDIMITCEGWFEWDMNNDPLVISLNKLMRKRFLQTEWGNVLEHSSGSVVVFYTVYTQKEYLESYFQF